MEMMILNRCCKSSSSYRFKDKSETKKSFEPSNTVIKEPIAISIEELSQISGKIRLEEKKKNHS